MGLIIRQSIKASLSNYAGLVIGYINILILMPKVFQASEVGISRFIIDISGVLAGFASLGLTYSMSRFFPKFKDNQSPYHNGFTFWVYSIPIVGLLLLAAVLLLCGPSLLNILKDGGSSTINYLHIIIPLSVIMVFTLVTEQYCAQFGRIVVVNIVRENGLRLANLFLIILAYNSVISFNAFIVWLLVSYSLVLAIDVIYLFSLNPLSLSPDINFIKNNKTLRNDFFGFTGVILFGSIAPLIITRSDYFSVSMIGGDTLLGIYSTAMSIAIMVELPKRVILPIVQPVISRLIHEHKWSELKEIVGKGNLNQVLLGMFILFGLWFNVDSIFELMPNGHIYKAGKWVILIVGIGKLIELFAILPGVVVNNSHFYKWNIVTAFTALFVIFLTYHYAVPIWAINGTAIGVSMGYLVVALINNSLVYKYYKLHWLSFDWIKLGFVFVVMLVLNYYTPYFSNNWLNIFVRSGALLSTFAILVFGLKISKDLNSTSQQLLKGTFRWF